MNNNDLYKDKYLKYKFKYLELKELYGGTDPDVPKDIILYNHGKSTIKIGNIQIHNLKVNKLLNITSINLETTNKIDIRRTTCKYLIIGEYIKIKEYFNNNKKIPIIPGETYKFNVTTFYLDDKINDNENMLSDRKALINLILVNTNDKKSFEHYFPSLRGIKQDIYNYFGEKLNDFKNYHTEEATFRRAIKY